MSRYRPKHGSVLSAAKPVASNVVHLSTRRSYLMPHSHPNRIFYVTEEKKRLSLLESIPSLKIEVVESRSQLKTKMMLHSPELVVVESILSWADSMQLIRDMDYFLDVPIVLLCDAEQKKQRAFLVREAYASGVHDILFAPFDAEDIKQTLGVLLKFQQAATSV